jgi:pimeloyl-ACP methyl ester carboxylesterase
MAEAGKSTRRWVTGAAVAAGAVGTLAAWAAQHRAVRRAAEQAEAQAPAEELELPADLEHHEILTADGGRIHVVERGSGPTLLLLHGFMLSSDIWVHQFAELAARHRVVAVDLRGHGRSAPGTGRFRAPAPAPGAGTDDRGAGVADAVRRAGRGEGAPGMARMAADVRTVIESLDLRDCLLVGHSMGGMVALQLLHDLPAAERHRRIAGLVLVSTGAGPFVTLPGWGALSPVVGPAASRAALVAERAGARLVPSEDLRWWVSRLGFGPEASPAQVRLVERLHRGTPEGTLSELIPSFAVFDLSAGLGDVDMPALVVVGSKDRLLGNAHARRMAGALPRAELVELPRCGHMPMLERRHEFSRLLDEFAAKVG